MKTKKILFLTFTSMLVLFFVACENGVSFDPSDFDDNDGSINNEINDEREPTPENPVGKGSHSFTLDFTPNQEGSLPEKFEFQPLEFIYAGITATTGDGFKLTFTLSIDVPDTLDVSESGEEFPDGSQNITATIDPYMMTEGLKNFPTIYFNDTVDLKTFTFTPDANTATITVIYKESPIGQKGSLPIMFRYNENVYKETMPRKLLLGVYSKGNAEPKNIVLGGLVEQSDDGAVIVYKPDDYVLTIKDESLWSAQNENYVIPLTMRFLNVLPDYPIIVTAKEGGENLNVSDIMVNGDTATFTATHSGVKQLQASNGTVTLTVDSEHQSVYSGLPFDIVINTQRDETFKYYIDTFDVSTSTENLSDTSGYYTEVRIPGISDATDTDMLTYVISRKDDRSTEFKQIDTRTIPAKEAFVYKDYNAFILRNPVQEYKITVAHTCDITDCSAEVELDGSRMLTNRELFLAAMDSMRYALIDSERTGVSGGGIHADTGVHDIQLSLIGSQWATTKADGTFKQERSYYSGEMSYKHTYIIGDSVKASDNSYKPYFMGLDGKFAYTSDEGGLSDSRNINTVDTYWIWAVKAPFTGKVDFTSPYGDGSITFNSININNNTWSNPSWANGSFTVNGGGKEVTYTNDKNNSMYVPFGFYMTNGEFLARPELNKDNYTQK